MHKGEDRPTLLKMIGSKSFMRPDSDFTFKESLLYDFNEMQEVLLRKGGDGEKNLSCLF
jgi:hypothetical protein